MIDRTSDFVKAVKQCQKDAGLAGKSLLFRNSKPTTLFGKHSTEIVSSITRLRDFLLKNQKMYIGSISDFSELSEQERVNFDAESEKCMKTCSDALTSLKQREMPTNPVSQENLHKKYTIEMIEQYLKNVCQIYSKQQAIHVKKIVDKKRISRLQSDLLKRDVNKPEPAKTETTKPDTNHNSFLFESSDDELSPEEEAAFRQENAQLFSDMNSLVDEVKAIEGKVVEIARLQELFSEQVFKQEGEIEAVSETIIESSENVKDGNEELREAIKNNAGFRVWILFFLVMCSFSLLFLEWYS